MFDVPKNTLSGWIKKSESIKEGYAKFGPKRRNMRTGNYEELESALLLVVKRNPLIRMRLTSGRDIYNADETGLFFKLTPDKTLEFKNVKCVGGKRSKERITVLVCANMTGEDKVPLFVIGK
ncbi:uncharacterized protein LOC123545424 [Mercenaria mercenaria]|uniref:uncharacterized protein LOC123545424 n=1 Tax=Mercenaria mercenaria TaxID=6596 RepID=UPI00234F42A8|nr:uncharacterized protein LOC123545424 [Mercenaria mercenaria]